MRTIGFVNLQGLVLFGLYVLGIVGGVGTALLLAIRSCAGRIRPSSSRCRNSVCRTSNVAMKLLDRVRVFLRRAGTVIFAVPSSSGRSRIFRGRPRMERARIDARATAAAGSSGAALDDASRRHRKPSGGRASRAELARRAGHVVEPVFAPLGWDWRVSAAVIAGFPAREVVVAVLGTIYAVGDEADEQSLAGRLQAATWPDGSPVFTLPMVLGFLLFYAWCLQCAATLAVIRRETNSWRWPVFAWAYMTILGYGGALAIFQLGSA